MATSFDLINRAMGGDLPHYLESLRTQGLSQDRVARTLEDAGWLVSRETVRRWYKDLDSKAPAGV